ncbi:MAG: mechanosensitive ion channel family protein [Bacteroidetes bacterium]|nr:mechanosensitive ion channel family protein [Bacteroidota bacterium]
MIALDQTELKWLYSAIGIVAVYLIKLVVSRIISRRLRNADFNLQRKKIILKALNLLYIIVLVAILTGVWGLDREQVLAFVTSVLAVLGVGFFAQWSLLSNITAGIILYFNHPLKIGDYITILDKDEPMAGIIEDISLFFLHVRDDLGDVYTIPNTVVIQKTITLGKPKKKREKRKPVETPNA